MSKNQASIDGFVPRRPGNQLGELHKVKHPDAAVKPIDRTLHTTEMVKQQPRRRQMQSTTPQAFVGTARSGQEIGRADLEDSLRSIDDESLQDGGKKSRRQRRKDKRAGNKSRSKIARIIKWAAIVLVVIAIGVIAFLVVKGMNAGNNAFTGNIFDIVQNEPLKEDENGRSNFLLLGTSEDDPGHEAGYLTDSIMILSIDQTNKNAYTFSIPRDLYVDYEMACLSGYKGKVNVYFNCVNDGEDDAAEQDRLEKTRAFIGGIVGMDLQYAVHVNYTVMRDVVNAIGGSIDVNIESRDPRGVMDSNFDWKCGANYSKRIQTCPPSGHYIDYPNGPVTLDAEHALYLAQARGDIAPTYGFEQSNFDRERNQQMILVAIREKALSAQTLTNLGKVTGLIDALGSNLRTNIETKEVRTLMDLGQNIKTADIVSIDLYSTENPIFTTGPLPGAGSSVYPRAGVGNYTELQQYLHKQLTSNPVVKEAANITVLNGSGVAGVGQTVADSLTEKEFIIDEVGNAPEGTYAAIEIYQINTDKTATASKLEEIYGVKVKTTAPPLSVTGSTDFVIIVGIAPKTTE
ncbi:MAG: LCP family protein [Patescibacteria group bacterium]